VVKKNALESSVLTFNPEHLCEFEPNIKVSITHTTTTPLQFKMHFRVNYEYRKLLYISNFLSSISINNAN